VKRHHAKILPRRFTAFLAIFVVATLALAAARIPWSQALLTGFDAAALAFIASLWPLTRDHSATQIRRHAIENDANRLGVLVITSLVMLVITTALFIAIPDARTATGTARAAHLLLVLGSLIIAWLFSNLVYALHYAHMYYTGVDGGLNFPEQRDAPIDRQHCPDFWDFAYYATTIGMAFATSDIEVTQPAIRRVTMAHGIAAFFYNLIVLAFTINVTAGG
jgi:uncharacterized membrane protein